MKLPAVLDIINIWTLEHFYIKSLGQKYTLSSFNNFFTHVIDIQPNSFAFL